MTQPIKVEITLDIDNYLARFPNGIGPDGEGGHSTTIEELVVMEAARQFLTRLDEQTKRDLTNLYLAAVKVKVAEHAAAAVQELLDGDYQPVNDYGEPRGPRKTLREDIVRIASTWLTSKTQYADRSNLVDAVTKETEKVIKTELADAVKQVREQAIARASEIAAQALGKATMDLMKT